MFKNFFFFENRAVYEKYCTTGQATDDNMAAHCMLDTKGYRHTLRICNTYCLSITAKVARTRLDFTLYVHCLSCYVNIPPACFSVDTVSTCNTRNATQIKKRKQFHIDMSCTLLYHAHNHFIHRRQVCSATRVT